MDIPTDDGKKIVKVDFSYVSQYCEDDYMPVLLVIGNKIFRLNSWEELLKIYFYIVAKTDDGNKLLSGRNKLAGV